MAQKKILIVEDDENIAELLSIHLKDEGFEVTHASEGNLASSLIEENEWDALVLDIMLPGKDGLELCRQVRKKEVYTPVIIISARASEFHRVLGLELGADDYLTKPFSMLELSARVKAIFRRQHAIQNTMLKKPSRIYAGEFIIDSLSRQIYLKDKALDLTPREYDLLFHFIRNPGKIFSRLNLLNIVWGYQYEGYEHTVNTHINRLRIKIELQPNEPKRILTVWGQGYKFSLQDNSEGEQ